MGAGFFGFVDAELDVADTGEIFVELHAVAAGNLALQRPAVVEDEVENRALLLLAEEEILLALIARAGAEETLEE